MAAEHYNRLRDHILDIFGKERRKLTDNTVNEKDISRLNDYPNGDDHPHATAHEDKLALSWDVGVHYFISCTYRSALKQFGNQNSRAPNRSEKDKMLEDAYARYDGVKKGRYKFDCYIFYKDNSVPTNIPTNINATMEPAFHQAFHQTPLHCHFAIWRMQRPNASSNVVEYTDWYAYKEHDGICSIDGAANHFTEVVLIKSAPERPKKPCPIWKILLIVAAVLTTLALLLFAFRNPLAEQFGFSTPEQRAEMEEALQQLRDDARVLQERYQSELRFVEAYQNRLNQLTSSGAPRHEIEALERDLARSQQNLEQVTAQLAETGAQLEPTRTGTGLAACWMTSGDEPRTAYLFDLYLDDRGITVNYAENAVARASQDGVPVINIPMGTPLSPQSFIEATRPVFAASEADPRCRHFVILREGVHASTTTYQRQRDAVEQHFYIFRP